MTTHPNSTEKLLERAIFDIIMGDKSLSKKILKLDVTVIADDVNVIVYTLVELLDSHCHDTHSLPVELLPTTKAGVQAARLKATIKASL